jgi:hypothetical protein
MPPSKSVPIHVHDIALSFISTAYITCSWKSVVNSFRHPQKNLQVRILKNRKRRREEEKDAKEDGMEYEKEEE